MLILRAGRRGEWPGASRGSTREEGAGVARAPRVLESLARRFSDDGVAVRFEVIGVERLGPKARAQPRPATIGLVTAALIVGSSILVAFASGHASFAMSFFGAIGILVAIANIAWLMVSIRRGGRDDR